MICTISFWILCLAFISFVIGLILSAILPSLDENKDCWPGEERNHPVANVFLIPGFIVSYLCLCILAALDFGYSNESAPVPDTRTIELEVTKKTKVSASIESESQTVHLKDP